MNYDYALLLQVRPTRLDYRRLSYPHLQASPNLKLHCHLPGHTLFKKVSLKS